MAAGSPKGLKRETLAGLDIRIGPAIVRTHRGSEWKKSPCAPARSRAGAVWDRAQCVDGGARRARQRFHRARMVMRTTAQVKRRSSDVVVVAGGARHVVRAAARRPARPAARLLRDERAGEACGSCPGDHWWACEPWLLTRKRENAPGSAGASPTRVRVCILGRFGARLLGQQAILLG